MIHMASEETQRSSKQEDRLEDREIVAALRRELERGPVMTMRSARTPLASGLEVAFASERTEKRSENKGPSKPYTTRTASKTG